MTPSVAEEDDVSRIAVQSRLMELEHAVFGTNHEMSLENHQTAKGQAVEMPLASMSGTLQDATSSRWLEEICGGLTGTALEPSKDAVLLAFKTTDQIALDFNVLEEQKPTCLPPRAFACRVLDVFEESLEPALQVMHVSSVRTKIQQLYDQGPWQSAESRTGLVTLLLAMSAHIGFWDSLKSHGLFSNGEVAKKASTVLAKQAIDALHCDRTSTVPSIEMIQAAVVLFFLLAYTEGYSARARELHWTALSLARELSLHKLDDIIRRKPCYLTQVDIIEAETGRKLWWHIASTDWLLAFHSGPTEGVYSVNPQQMKVKMPRNLNSGDLSTYNADFSRPNNEATTMSYSLFRIKLAETCREAVDTVLVHEPVSVSYGKVHELDAKFVAIATSLPSLLQLDVSPHTIRHDFGEQRANHFGLQRALANLMVSVRRCKLHLPFLMRCGSNPLYAFSRNACIESACRLLAIRQAFLDDSNCHLSSLLHLLDIHQFLFYATVVLVLDICANRPHDDVQLARVHEALNMINEVRNTNRTASRLLKALHDVLQRHGISLPETQSRLSMVERQADTPLITDRSMSLQCTTADISYDPSIGMPDLQLDWPENSANDWIFDSECWDDLLNLDLQLI